MDCQQIQRILTTDSLVRACDVVHPRGLHRGQEWFRVQTRFRYPGGEYVDLYVVPGQGGSFELSDSAGTMEQLLGMGLDPDTSQKRRQFIQDVCEDLGVVRRGGEFVVSLGGDMAASLPVAALHLGQACVRIADLSLTQRGYAASSFTDELEEGIEALGLRAEPNKALPGRGGRMVPVSYIVEGSKSSSALITVTAKHAGTAHAVANEAFTRWYDLDRHQTDLQFLTVVDSERADLFRPADLERLEEVSEVVQYPDEKERFRELLAA